METTIGRNNGNKVCELDKHMWSVIVSTGVFARGCTYAQAQRFAENWYRNYHDHGVAVVTDDAANRYMMTLLAKDEEII